MLGCPEDPGVIFHTMMELYRRIDAIKKTKTCHVKVSYCEVYLCVCVCVHVCVCVCVC